MPLLGALIQQSLRLTSRVKLPRRSVIKAQERELKGLLNKAQNTSFGRHFHFDKILSSPDVVTEFQRTVPIYNYNSIFKEWWHRCLEEEKDVCWPGQIKYFALSSGTSESASKHIPVTREMIRALRKASIRQILTLGKYDLPSTTFEKGKY
jgi:hypothetical protein